MEVQEMLLDPFFHADGAIFRTDGFFECSTPNDAKVFLMSYLVAETTTDVDYTFEELEKAYSRIKTLLESNGFVSTSQLPYHPKKRRPSEEKKYVLDGCTCRIIGR